MLQADVEQYTQWAYFHIRIYKPQTLASYLPEVFCCHKGDSLCAVHYAILSQRQSLQADRLTVLQKDTFCCITSALLLRQDPSVWKASKAQVTFLIGIHNIDMFVSELELNI